MLKKIALALVVILVGFLGYVSTREGHFRYERSGVIDAPPAKVYEYLSDFRHGQEWSPYEKADPTMKKVFQGDGNHVGDILEFEGNSESGSGALEMVKQVPNESVEIKLTMTKPFHAENLIEYKLAPEGDGTRFTWAMSGDGGFLGKLMNVFIDCEKMVAGQFETGIANLKSVLETPKT